MPDQRPPARRNVMLTLSYDGTAYCGWQIQPNGITIQQCVERAVQKLTGVHSNVLCAGRTDSGVHALGQVANFRTDCNIPATQLRRALQSFLPRDIVILEARDVADEFHATYSAVSKTYRYVLFDNPVCPPFLNRYVSRSRRRLNVPAMQEAVGSLLGTHDFRCFETHYPNKQTSIRTIHAVSIGRQPLWSPWTFPPASHLRSAGHQSVDQQSVDHRSQSADSRSMDPDHDSPLIVFEVTADGFLYNMVRAIAGTLTRIGDGRRGPDDMAQVIASMDRSSAGMTAPAEGLYLVEVRYPLELLQESRDSQCAS